MTENTENGDATKPSGLIDVWIRQKKETGFTCMVVHDDKSTYAFDLVSLTLAAAQQEATERLMAGGHHPAWQMESGRNFADIQATRTSAVLGFGPRQASAPTSGT